MHLGYNLPGVEKLPNRTGPLYDFGKSHPVFQNLKLILFIFSHLLAER